MSIIWQYKCPYSILYYLKEYAEKFFEVANSMAGGAIPKELTINMVKLWKDPAVQLCYSRGTEVHLNDSAK